MVGLADDKKHIFYQYNKELVKYWNKDVNVDYTHTVAMLWTQTVVQEADDQGRRSKISFGISVLRAQDKREHKQFDVLTTYQCNLSTYITPLFLYLCKYQATYHVFFLRKKKWPRVWSKKKERKKKERKTLSTILIHWVSSVIKSEWNSELSICF